MSTRSRLGEAAIIGLVATAAVEGAKAVHDLTPSVGDVAGGGAGPQLRAGELAAGVTVVAIGGALAWAAGDLRPFLAMAGVALVVVLVYEWIHRRAQGRG